MVERRTTPVELLWDLVFVFAVTRVTTLLSHDLSWAGFGRGLLVLALVWWAWSAFVWAANAEDPDSRVLRAVLLLALVLVFVAGLALPRAFGSDALLFVGAYVAVRLVHLGLYADASRRGHAAWSAIAGFAITVAIGMGLLVAGALASGWLRALLWIAAAAIDYAGPAWLTRERLRGLQEVAVAHFAERYALFVIICLGESIVGIGTGAVGRPLHARLLVAVAAALVVTVELWWLYFDRDADEAEEALGRHADPVLAAADAYSYLHLVLVAGVIVFAVGAKEAVEHAGAPLGTATRLALCGGVALFVAGQAAFRLRLVAAKGLLRPAAASGCLVVFAAAGGLPAWGTAMLLAGLLAVLLALEAHGGRTVEAAAGAGASA
jgi:low temperature requirement protein LtrA